MAPYDGDLFDADGSRERPRIPWREAKRSRRLRTWDSLPSLKVAPADRPLFSCRRCGYANILVALCPWCLCACAETTKFCVDVKPRRRRVSSPSFLSDAQKAQLRRIEQRDRAAQSGCLVASTSMSTRSHGVLPGGDDPVAYDRSRAFSPAKTDRRRRRQAAVYSAMDVIATVTTNVELEPFVRELLGNLEESPAPTSPSSPTLSDSAESSDMIIPMVPDCHNDLSPAMDENDTTLIPMSTISYPSLRRKHRIAVRQRSSCSLRRRATASALTTSPTARRAELSVPLYGPTPDRPKTLRSTTGSVRSVISTDDVPLGHPQRPLYTAIRKNMFVPPAPAPSATPSLADPDGVSFRGTLRTRPSRSLDIPRPSPAYDFGTAPRAYAHPREAFPVPAGCSLSGETELRMDLARSRSMDGVPARYQFRARQEGAVKERVKNFGKGLRDLLLRRA